MTSSVIVWDIETVPDLRGYAAAKGLVGRPDDEVRSEMGDKFPKLIYHSIERRAGLFRDYPTDLFDLIIVDECHRGSARDDSSWRVILEHFKPAYQLGMAATPLRQPIDKLETRLFGEPQWRDAGAARCPCRGRYWMPTRSARIRLLEPDYACVTQAFYQKVSQNDAAVGGRLMEWFSRTTSIAGTQVPNWAIVLGVIIIILIIYNVL
jgi:Type III restriction enzyme, res subunit